METDQIFTVDRIKKRRIRGVSMAYGMEKREKKSSFILFLKMFAGGWRLEVCARDLFMAYLSCSLSLFPPLSPPSI